MKKNDWLLLTALAAYGVLFYRELPGINFLIFTILLVGLLIIRNQSVIRSREWWLSAIGSLVSGACIAYHGTGWAVTANLISLSLLAGFSLSGRTSVLAALFFSVYSYLTAPLFLFLKIIQKNGKKQSTSTARKRLMIYIFSGVVVILFFLLYQKANPIFEHFTQQINLDFISLPWLRFMLLGFVLIYGFFNWRKIETFAKTDESGSDHLKKPAAEKTFNLLGFKINLTDEFLSGMILFILLNGLLAVVNIPDIIYLLSDGSLPEGMSYSQFVHQGVGALIMSVIAAVLLIMFYFRGALNFHKKGKGLRLLGFIWVIQNIFMIISAGYRNYLYVSEYSLTYKRIGVFIWLLLCVIGLIITFIKIAGRNSNRFLIRKNAWAFYGVLVITGLFNWSLIITDFNIQQARQKDCILDKKYLTENLSDSNLPALLSLGSEFKHKGKYRMNSRYYYGGELSDYYEDVSAEQMFRRHTHLKLYNFLSKLDATSWRSWNYDTQRVQNELDLLSQQGILDTLFLSGNSLETMLPLRQFENLKVLHFADNNWKNTKELKYFTHLEKLYLGAITKKRLETIKKELPDTEIIHRISTVKVK